MVSWWMQSSLTDAQRLLQQQGLDTSAVSGATRTATAQASGIFDQVGCHSNTSLCTYTDSIRHLNIDAAARRHFGVDVHLVDQLTS